MPELDYLLADDMQSAILDSVTREFLESLPEIPRKRNAKVICGTFGTFNVNDVKIMEEHGE